MGRPERVAVSPAVRADELSQLSAVYGAPVRRHFRVELDAYMFATRHQRRHDRRAEVLFAITRPNGKILIHTKPGYPVGTFRLFTGGIGLRESVLEALRREVDEETGLNCTIARFLALCTYSFVKGDFAMEFATYLFHLQADGAQPLAPKDKTEIAGIGEVRPEGLPTVAQRLRNLECRRKAWGAWRAIGHDLAYETLSQGAVAC